MSLNYPYGLKMQLKWSLILSFAFCIYVEHTDFPLSNFLTIEFSVSLGQFYPWSNLCTR